MSLEKIWAALLAVEEAESLPSWRVGDVYLWQVIRERLFTHIAEQLGLYQPVPAKEPIPQQREVPIQESDVAVLPFVRRDAAGSDPFSVGIIEAAEKVAGPALVFGIGASDVGSGLPQFETLDKLFIQRARFAAKLRVVTTQRKHHAETWARVISYLETELSVDLAKYRAFPRWLLVDFISREKGWYSLFRTSKSKVLFAVNAWQLPTVAGAKRAGLRVIEPQHGVISSMHPRLAWKDEIGGAYLPDEFWQWGSYWGEALPASVKRVTIGAPTFLTAQRGVAKKRQLLVIGQPQQSKNIIQFARFIAASVKNLEVVFKPHPQENLDEVNSVLDSFGERPANLSVASPTAETLPMIAESEFVVGVYSTALFEAVALGCKVGVLKLDGWKHVHTLVIDGEATLIAQVSDIGKFLTTSKPSLTSKRYYADPVDLESLVAGVLNVGA
jgi:hypothetical protein